MGSTVVPCSGRSGTGGQCRALKPTFVHWFPALGPRHGPGNGPEEDFDLDFIQISILKFDHLVEFFVPNRLFALLEGLKLALNYHVAHGPLAHLISLNARLQWDVEYDESAGDLALLC